MVDDAFPGWVEFHIVDASGRLHRCVEKAPVIGYRDPSLPCDLWVACHVVRTLTQGAQGDAIEVDTSPWGIGSDEGVTRFVVAASQVDASST
ncbi:MAG: hypothetical protein C0521_13225 [Xanthomonas sp.]|nr:hypothetical protein [Xanthomonas sp.]